MSQGNGKQTPAWLERLVVGGRSIRVRLILLALAPLVVVLPVLVMVLAIWGSDYFERLLVTKVRSDLAVAHGYYERVTEGVGRSVEAMAGSERLARTMKTGNPEHVQRWLRGVREDLNLDFLHLLDAQGRVIASGEGLQAGYGFAQWPVVASALEEQKAKTGTDVFSVELLNSISPGLAAQAHIPLVSTRNAAPDQRQAETRGLVVHGAAPVLNARGELVAVLAGGMLLNRSLAFIDRLNEVVYPDGALPLGSVGTATLFLGDVRVATNVRLFEGERAIGTRVSAVVHEAVLGRGTTWLDRAFVVQDWYVSAYEPLVDSWGQRVGMLYVGFLEAPFVAVERTALQLVLGLFAVAMVLGALFAVLWSRRVFKPLERMHATMTAVEQGQGGARVGPVGSQDEIGELATHLDHVLARLEEQTASLKRWGDSLDAEVAHRTADLEKTMADLKATQSQLVMNEKMAAIGQLTAGVAHEINNPVAVIQGNLEVAREILGEASKPVEPEMRLIQEQVHRIRLIVAKLLQFARPQEYSGYLELVSTPKLFQDSLVLVGHLLKKGNIAIEQHCDSSRQVMCNPNELQQVLINLLVNAIQAMPEGGVLVLAAEDWDETDMPLGLRISVSDSGPGISEADAQRLFSPFFTAKKPGGTGLGLWVSKTLVERYGGKITLEPGATGGSRFVVWLRCEPLSS